MKKILILGSSGFIGKSLSQLLNKEKYDIISLNRSQLDVTDFEKLRTTLDRTRPDFVINCALSGEGRLLKQDSPQNFYENLQIQENLIHLQNFYSKLFIFSSGAQEDRTKDINNLKEGEFGPPPNNYYSLAKYINAKRAIGNNKIINIRIFNVFGALEKDNRFIKSCLLKYIRNKNETVEVWGNQKFDFFYIKDLKILIENYFENPPEKYEEINAVYLDKNCFMGIIDMIGCLDNRKLIWVEKNNLNRKYTGNGTKLYNMNLPLIGLKKGIEEVYKELKNGHN